MNLITKTLRNIDASQRKHSLFGFIYAVVKKYGEDNAGYLGAVITYYGLLSLFPLLIVFTSLSQLLLRNDPSLRNRLSSSVTHYFPIIGNQLQQGIHSPKRTGIALIISLLVMLYGARGIASAFQYSLNSLWHTPSFKQPPFLKNLARSFGIIGAGGIGLIAAVFLSSYTVALGHAIVIKILATLLSVVILWLMFIILFKLAVAGHKHIHSVITGAAVAAVGIQILQTGGGAILAHELKGLNNIYGTFALVIGLLFWIYLQAEVVLYAAEVQVVKNYHLFPRSLQGSLTDSDKLAYTRYAKGTRQNKDEKIDVHFTSGKSPK